MASAGHFKDGDVSHFYMASDGKLYLINEKLAARLAKGNLRGSATIDHVDPETNTIYFRSPLPKDLKV